MYQLSIVWPSIKSIRVVFASETFKCGFSRGRGRGFVSWWCFSNGEISHISNKILKCSTFLIDEMDQRLYSVNIAQVFSTHLAIFASACRAELPCCQGKFCVPCRQASSFKSHQIRRILAQYHYFHQHFRVGHKSQNTGAIQFRKLTVQTGGVWSACSWG